MGVGDHQAHTGEAALAQRPQEARPEAFVLAVAHGQAEDFAVAVSGDTGGHDDRLGHHPGTLVGFHVGRVEKHVGELDVIQAPFPELGDGGVELGADAADLALGHAGVDAQRGDEVVDLAGRLTPCTNASMITAHNARSMRRRGSNKLG